MLLIVHKIHRVGVHNEERGFRIIKEKMIKDNKEDQKVRITKLSPKVNYKDKTKIDLTATSNKKITTFAGPCSPPRPRIRELSEADVLPYAAISGPR